MKSLLPWVILLLSLSLSGCANLLNRLVPDVYLVDRPTLMEADAAGDWPQLEQRLLWIEHHPEPLSGLEASQNPAPRFQVLNDDFAPDSSEQ